ncbi:hypothetical protein CBS101457_001469 [Exobasidium rhododendri]|nr:hypothetical protein CBS101457_001469 [Exobasidium rhododendri]
MSSIDTSKFGKGFVPNKENFIFAGGLSFDKKEGAGAGVPVRGYEGPWPVFGKPEDSWEQQSDVGWNVGQGPSAGSSSSGSASSSSSPLRRPRWMCKSTGRCTACPSDELYRPYCRPYGNRAPIECRPVTVLPAMTKPTIPDHMDMDKSKMPILPGRPKEAGKERNWSNAIEDQLWSRQETILGSDIYKGFQVCGRDEAQATWNFSKFVGFNLIFALIGLFILLQRQRLLAGQHQSMLARRIGRI